MTTRLMILCALGALACGGGGSSAPATTPAAATAEPATTPTATTAAPAETPAAPAASVIDQAALDAGIRRIDVGRYEIDLVLWDRLRADPSPWLVGARIVPIVLGGRAAGLKLQGIRADSIYARLGLANGDRIDAINGFPLPTAAEGLEIYEKVREAQAFELEITRGGSPLTLAYSIR